MARSGVPTRRSTSPRWSPRPGAKAGQEEFVRGDTGAGGCLHGARSHRRCGIVGESSAATCPLVKRGTLRGYAVPLASSKPGYRIPAGHRRRDVDHAPAAETFAHPPRSRPRRVALWHPCPLVTVPHCDLARGVGVTGLENRVRDPTAPSVTSVAAVLRGPRGNTEALCRTFIHSCGQLCGQLRWKGRSRGVGPRSPTPTTPLRISFVR